MHTHEPLTADELFDFDREWVAVAESNVGTPSEQYAARMFRRYEATLRASRRPWWHYAAAALAVLAIGVLVTLAVVGPLTDTAAVFLSDRGVG